MTSLSVKRSCSVLLCTLLVCQAAYASPWAEKQGYGEKTAGKFLFGLKNSLLGWTEIFTEPWDSKYDLKKSEWEGFCDGIAQSIFYTANGLIHLATFPVPVDFPDMGAGTLPGLGKKGTPKPWEVHGKSKYRVVPAEEVTETKPAVSSRALPVQPPPAQTPAAYASSYQTVPPAPASVNRIVAVSQTIVPPQQAAAEPLQESTDISSRIK